MLKLGVARIGTYAIGYLHVDICRSDSPEPAKPGEDDAFRPMRPQFSFIYVYPFLF